MKFAFAQHLRQADYAPIEAQIDDAFEKLIFAPLAEIVRRYSPQPTKMFLNAAELPKGSPLIDALASGRVQYNDGVFSGRFNAALSRALQELGAKWNSRFRVYYLPQGKVPPVIVAQAALYRGAAQEAHREIRAKLDEITKKLETGQGEFNFEGEEVVRRLDKGWRDSARMMEVLPDMGPGAIEILAKRYTSGLVAPVTNLAQFEVQRMRRIVQENAESGARFTELIEEFQNRFDVSQARARLLAKTETSIFLSEHRKARWEEAGILRYKWQTTGKPNVRPCHQHLNGGIYFYSDPPIADDRYGRRANPGGIYNCQCTDLPVIEGW